MSRRALVCGCLCALVCGLPLQTTDFEHVDSSLPLLDGSESLGDVWKDELGMFHRLLMASEDDPSSDEAGSGPDSSDDDDDSEGRRWRRNSATFLGFLSTMVALACIYLVFSSGGLVILDESDGQHALKLKPGCAINVLSQIAFMLKAAKRRKKQRKAAKEGENTEDDHDHGFLRRGGNLFTCLTIRCFRPMHKDLPRVIAEVYEMVLSKKWKSLTAQQRRIGAGLRRPIFVCNCTNELGVPCDKVFDGEAHQDVSLKAPIEVQRMRDANEVRLAEESHKRADALRAEQGLLNEVIAQRVQHGAGILELDEQAAAKSIEIAKEEEALQEQLRELRAYYSLKAHIVEEHGVEPSIAHFGSYYEDPGHEPGRKASLWRRRKPNWRKTSLLEKVVEDHVRHNNVDAGINVPLLVSQLAQVTRWAHMNPVQLGGVGGAG